MCYPQIKKLREEAGLTQTQVGNATDIPVQDYIAIEIGEIEACTSLLTRIADLYDVTVEHLVQA